MKKNAFWHWLVLAALVFSSIALFMTYGLNYGIDLKGGFSFTLQVDEAKLVENLGKPLTEDERKEFQQQALEVLQNRVNGSGLREAIVYPEPNSLRIVMQIPGVGPEDRDKLTAMLEQVAFLAFRSVHKDNDSLTQQAFASGKAPRGYNLISDTRTSSDGQTYPVHYYVIDEDAKPLVENSSPQASGPELWRFQSVSPRFDFMLQREMENGSERFYPHYVSVREELTGSGVSGASISSDQFGRPTVSVRFDAEGSKKFGDITADLAPGGAKNPNPNERRQLAIVLDGTLYSAPNINEAIIHGSAEISGGFTFEEAQQLSVVLRAGSLPAPVEILTKSEISPTLGKDSINSGARAMIIGSIAVLIFMIIYYMIAGAVVNLALILDVLLLPLGMVLAAGFLGIFVNTGTPTGVGLPTLTLPGIAGLILTIGMAVDANVLIFERIREEQLAGKRFSSAVTAGFDKVFSTILDANVTTLLVAVILFLQGSGAIRGFAVTLSAGILVSMYSSLIFTRLVFEFLANKTSIEKVKMLSIVKQGLSFDFVGKRKIAGILSLLLIIGSGAMFFQKGMGNFAVDMTGGRSLMFAASPEQHPIAEVRTLLESLDISDPQISYQRDLSSTNQFLEVKVKLNDEVLNDGQTDDGDKVLAALTEKLGKGSFLQEQMVGSQVGEEMRTRGVKAIIFALIGIIIYITFRFEFGFALGTIVALVHDVLITVGVFCLMGNQISLPIIAALLTIVGYSANDTIVVFDRIREDLKLLKDKSYFEVANISINHTLGRTLMTSITTLITVVMLLIFGGGAIHDFALALFIGVIVGTYSSVFVATPSMLMWHAYSEKKKKA
ncbi:MAG: SecD/SecF fusion protein [Candidatus Omnitrophota bacterium]|jgi:SecD/SecF fusion protein